MHDRLNDSSDLSVFNGRIDPVYLWQRHVWFARCLSLNKYGMKRSCETRVNIHDRGPPQGNHPSIRLLLSRAFYRLMRGINVRGSTNLLIDFFYNKQPVNDIVWTDMDIYFYFYSFIFIFPNFSMTTSLNFIKHKHCIEKRNARRMISNSLYRYIITRRGYILEEWYSREFRIAIFARQSKIR